MKMLELCMFTLVIYTMQLFLVSLLTHIYDVWISYLSPFKIFQAKWYFYIPLGLVDVEANYLGTDIFLVLLSIFFEKYSNEALYDMMIRTSFSLCFSCKRVFSWTFCSHHWLWVMNYRSFYIFEFWSLVL